MVMFPNVLSNPFDLLNRNFATNLPAGEFSIRVTASQIKMFLQTSNIPFEEGHTCLQLHCPMCSSTLRNPKSPKWGSLYINMTTGTFICYSCKQVNNWRIFVDYINVLEMQTPTNERQTKLPQVQNECFITDKDKEEISKLYENSRFLSVENFPLQQLKAILNQFKLGKLSSETLVKFQVTFSTDKTSILFPFYDHENGLASLRIRTLDDTGGVKEVTLPKQSPIALFGYLTISQSQREVVLTASPADTMAVSQETNVPAIALPQGLKTMSPEILPLFEKFQKITLWLGNSINDWEMAKVFSKKLGERRCFFIRPREDQPAALIGLQKKLKLLNILKLAYPVSHKSITTFETLRQDVLDELSHKEQVAGIKWQRFPGLNKLLKGHRRGELTVFTGPTGSGKTTFMSEYSLDLCMQGVDQYFMGKF